MKNLPTHCSLRPIALLAALLVAGPLAAQNLVLSYDFNEASPVYASTGTLKAKLKGKGKEQKAGEPGSGVSGQPADRAWDASAATVQALDTESKAVNRNALAHDKDENAIDDLKAMTLVFWFHADQPLSSAANRFVFNASSATKATHGYYVRAVSRGNGPRRTQALEFFPCLNGAESKPVISQYFSAGSGYAKVGEWVFVAITWNGGRIDFYVGDRHSPAKPAGSGVFAGQLGDEKQALVLGNTGAGNRGFDGKLDNFRLYDGALSPVAIEALRTADVAGQPGA